MTPKTGQTRTFAVLVALMVSLMPLAAADAAAELADPKHVADDVDGSENDAEDLGSVDFSELGGLGSQRGSGQDDVELAETRLNAMDAEQIHAMPKPQPQAAGYLQYNEQFSANLFSGAASYTYPIEVPPGVQGLEPLLYLSYNHHASRALPAVAGTGWSLSLSYIYRDTQDTRSDASDDEFVLSLDGSHEKLVYVPSEGRYHTEHESYLFVQKIPGGENDKHEYWIVKAKDGTEYRFGYHQDSELVSSLEPYVVRWSLDQVRDVHGNAMAYAYVENPNSDKGAVYLSDVNYGASSIHFGYDYAIYSAPELYADGNVVVQSGILAEISIKHGNALVRKYLLGYQAMENKPFLASVAETGSDGASKLPPVEFSYRSFENGFQENATWQLPGDSYFGSDKDEGVRLLDVNGDGLIDIVKAKGPSHQVRLNNGNGFAGFQPVANFIPGGFVDSEGNDAGVRFLDYDANAKIDVVQSLSGVTQATLLKINTGAAWADASYSLPQGLSFVKKTKADSCTPPYLPDYDCQDPVSCDGDKCKRTCKKSTCTDSGTVVFTGDSYPRWNDNDYNEEDSGANFYPQADKCYMLEYTGSPDTDSDDSHCYDLYTIDYFGDGDYDEDCDGRDLDAYAGIGFVGNGNSNSWLSTVPGGDDYGFIGGVENSYWRNRYVSVYDKDSVPDQSGSNKGDWDGFNYEICDQAGTHIIYCAPSGQACSQWSKPLCGYGCAGEGTAAFVVMGVYADYNNNLWDALDDNAPECAYDIVDDNDYFGYGAYKVTAYAAQTDTQYPECTIPFEVKDMGVRLADVNADGRTDVILGTDSARKTWLNNGAGFSESTDWALPSEAYFTDSNGKNKGLALADVNGDGLIDLVRGEDNFRKTWINTGKGWVYAPEWAIPPEATFVSNEKGQGVELVDINLDGLTDLVKAKDASSTVWINTGKGWAFRQWPLPAGITFADLSHQIVDINGDGTLDIVRANSSERRTWTGTGAGPYSLVRVKNGLGGAIDIGYEKISSLDNTGNDDISDLSFSGYVVSSVTYDDGMGSKAATKYAYAGGLLDPETREFRGFSDVTVSNPDKTKSKHLFFQDSAMKGLEYLSQVFNQSDKLFMQVDNSYFSESKDGYYIVRLSATKESAYDGQGTSPRITRTAFGYDAFGNPANVSYFGNLSQSDDDRFMNFTYAVNTDAWIIDKPIKESLIANGKTMRETYYTYDDQNYGQPPSKGLLTREEYWNSGGSNPVHGYSYDSYGNLVKVTDPDGFSTSYSYGPEHVFVNKSTNALGHETRFEHDGGTGSLKSETDSNGHKVSYEYDLFGRQIKEIKPYDSASYPTREISYDFDGNAPEKVTVRMREQSLTPNTYDAYFFYDGFGMLIQAKSEADDSLQVARNTQYDSNGRVAYESNPHFVAFSQGYTNPGSVEGAVYAYDALDRVTEATNPDGTAKKIVYDRGLITVYDEKGHRKDYLTSEFGQVTKVSEYNGNEVYRTSYQYDAADSLLNITNDKGNTVKYTYDTLGRKVKLEDPNIGTWTYAYDSAGNLISQVNGNGNQLTMEYDSLGRITKKVALSGAISYAYDAGMNGTLSRIDIPIGTTELKYDDRLRITERAEAYDEIGFSTQYGYDALDRLTSLVQPDGTVMQYFYDDQGLTTQVSGALNQVKYNAQGLPLKKVYANGLVSEYVYDQANFRVTKIMTGDQQNFQYEYDAAGNIKKIEDLPASATYSMDYDDLDRLTKAGKAGVDAEKDYSFVYEYDSLGNIIKVVQGGQGTSTYEYGTKPIHAPSSIRHKSVLRIISISPEGPLALKEGGLQEFEVLAAGDDINYLWTVDGDEVSGEMAYSYKPGRADVGGHVVAVLVSDGESSEEKSVAVTVEYDSGCVPFGDVDYDSLLTGQDASLIVEHLQGHDLTEEQKSRADVNNDGKLTLVDSMLIGQYVNNARDTFPICSARGPPCGSYGDVNADGVVSSWDARLVASYIVGLNGLDDGQKSRADVNGDGRISVADSLLIAQFNVNVRDSFAVCG